jgi:multidrug efflux pump subunit AcrB
MAAYWLKPKPVAAEAEEIARGPGLYRAILSWSLRHRGVTLALAIAFFVGSLRLVPYIPTNLFNRSDDGLSTIAVNCRRGPPWRIPEQVSTRLTESLLEDENVATVLALMGGDSGEPGHPLRPAGSRGGTGYFPVGLSAPNPSGFPARPRSPHQFSGPGPQGERQGSPAVVLKGDESGQSQAGGGCPQREICVRCQGLVDVSCPRPVW